MTSIAVATPHSVRWRLGIERARTQVPMSSPTDAELVLRAREGDADAFRALVERYQQRIFWVARGMLGNDEDARDAAQEAFIRVHRHLDRFDLGMRFYTWLYQIVVNLSIDQIRRRKKRQGVSLEAVGDVPGGVEVQGEGIAQQELQERVQCVLDELPAKYKAVMVLSDLEGISAKQIADMTGTTHATVRWRHHRARKLFREAWEKKFGKERHVL
ncbi:MAG: sigma-70 family RNA polymerase sigma factor [Planctomycetota bacterium]